MHTNSHLFITFALQNKVLNFGQFTTKANRISPYFFNAGKFNNGSALWSLAQFYARHIIESNIEFDVLFGPAYKGITLASATACALSQMSKFDVPFCFNRKEEKNHGEGGILVGANLENQRVLIIDDVISAGTSIKHSIDIIKQNNGVVAGVTVALDRMEKSGTDVDIGEFSAIEEIENTYNIPVTAITNLSELLEYVKENKELNPYQDSINQYKIKYGI